MPNYFHQFDSNRCRFEGIMFAEVGEHQTLLHSWRVFRFGARNRDIFHSACRIALLSARVVGCCPDQQMINTRVTWASLPTPTLFVFCQFCLATEGWKSPRSAFRKCAVQMKRNFCLCLASEKIYARTQCAFPGALCNAFCPVGSFPWDARSSGKTVCILNKC